MTIKVLIVAFLLVAGSVLAQTSPTPAIQVPPGEGRPFILANRNGTYYYGSTSEGSWDSGWMGLWVNRKRVLSEQMRVRDAYEPERPMPFSEARCSVDPSNAWWMWNNLNRMISIHFIGSQSDSLHRYWGVPMIVPPLPWIADTGISKHDLNMCGELAAELKSTLISPMLRV